MKLRLTPVFASAFALMVPFAVHAEMLTLYTSQPNADAQKTVDAFTAAHPEVEVEWVRDGTTKQETGRWLNNRGENSHQPFRRRERAMQRFRSMRSSQKFTAVHSSVHNHFNQERHLYHRAIFKLNRAAALAEWRGLCAG